MSFRKNNTLTSPINRILIDLPSPSNISYIWNMGRLLGVCLLLQIISGLFLSFHYTRDINMAFTSVSHISRDVNSGWLMRLIHSNGARLFFVVIFLHIGRGVYFIRYSNKKVWLRGIILLLSLIGTRFLGYVLPWGQISFWGATVITNLLSAIPFLGNRLTLWIWGGFSVDKATLTRFFRLHFLMPFILTGLAIAHIVLLHEKGSNNPLGRPRNLDKIPFHPYFSWKDILGALLLISIIFNVLAIWPFVFSDPENFIPANALITPPHIQPEWYFLFAYAILRSIPNKLGGVIALFLSIGILARLTLSIKKINFQEYE